MVITRSNKKRRLEEEEASHSHLQQQQQLPPPDLISSLPDDVLAAIVTLLPSGDGARTQILSRRWLPIWPTLPLNLEAKTFAAAHAFLLARSSRRGGGAHCRRLSLTWTGSFHGFPKAADDLLRLPDLDGLHELELCYFPTTNNGGRTAAGPYNPVPMSMFRFSPTLRALTVCCHGSRLELFPKETTSTLDLSFPHLEELTLKSVVITEDSFHGVMSGCHALKSLVFHDNVGYSQLRICSPTLRSIGISGGPCFYAEIIVEDTPLLERLFQDGSVTTEETEFCITIFATAQHKIRVMQAPKLKILGYLRESISEFDPGKWSFQGREVVSVPNALCTVKILALDVACDDLDVVINLLTWFPCVKKLCMALGFSVWRNDEQRKSNDDVRLECLNEHLKIVELKGYRGIMSEESLVRFFLSNAKVLESLKFLIPRKKCYKKWISMKREKLCRLGAIASPAARLSFESEPDNHPPSSCVPIKHIHNLAMDDPFDTSSCACPHGDSDADYYE
nr:unnamed protein product [Digitaria exilis]